MSDGPSSQTSHSFRFRLDSAIESLSLPPKAKILVAVSGGPDSVALLSSFVRLAPRNQWSIRIGHVNHGLRGEEADEDQTFVIELAHSFGLEADVARTPIATNGSVEGRAREARYAALWEMLDGWGGDFLATGHTLDDQAETVLMRLLRGTGLIGLRAMRSRQDGLIRPFLSVPRRDILSALQEAEQPYRSDSSNLDRGHFRNRIRHDVMPILESVRPSAAASLARAAAVTDIDASFIERETERAVALMVLDQTAERIVASRALFLALHPSLCRHCLRALIGRIAGRLTDVDEAAVDRAIKSIRSGGRLVLPHAMVLEVEGRTFSLSMTETVETAWQPTQLGVPGEVKTEVGNLRADVLSMEADDLQRAIQVSGPLIALCKTGLKGKRLLVRPRKPGDRLRAVGGPGRRKLQDILVDRKIPRTLRDRIPVLEIEGEIVWVSGVALDEAFAAGPGEREAVRLVFQPLEPELPC